MNRGFEVVSRYQNAGLRCLNEQPSMLPAMTFVRLKILFFQAFGN